MSILDSFFAPNNNLQLLEINVNYRPFETRIIGKGCNKAFTQVSWCEDFNKNDVDQLLNYLIGSSVKKLILCGVILTNEDFARLLDSNLETLVLDLPEDNNINISPLKYNTSLKSFEYSLHTSQDFYDGKILEEILTENKTLTWLVISRQKIDDYEAFIRGLSRNNTLEELCLCRPSINVSQIKQSLMFNYTLQRIVYGLRPAQEFNDFFSKEQRDQRRQNARRFSRTKSARML